MRDKQVNLTRSFPSFLERLGAVPGGLPSLHIGVVSSDMGTHATLHAGPTQVGSPGDGGCKDSGDNGALKPSDAPITNGKPYLEDLVDTAGSRKPNYTGSLSDAFGKMALGVGAGGCGFEQHLEAIKTALQPGQASSAGFVRSGDSATGDPEAYLGVIIVADEDDCSLADAGLFSNNPALGPLQSFRCTRYGVSCEDGGQTTDAMNQTGVKNRCHPNDGSQYLTRVADYATFLKGLKSSPAKVIVAGIMGALTPFAVESRLPPGGDMAVSALVHSCAYIGDDGLEAADPPVRLQSFLEQFPNRNTPGSICQRDLSAGLQRVAELLKTAIGYPCIQGTLADVDPLTSGPQYDCSVSSVGSATTELPHCPVDLPASGQTPCWRLVTEPNLCPGGDHLQIAIEGKALLSVDARIVASCVIGPTV